MRSNITRIYFRCGLQLSSPETMEKCANCGHDLDGLGKFFRSMSEFESIRKSADGNLAKMSGGGQQDALPQLLQVKQVQYIPDTRSMIASNEN